jgi:hypothetical protein
MGLLCCACYDGQGVVMATYYCCLYVRYVYPAPIPPPNQSPIEEISDLLDNLPVNACVELTRQLLTAVPTLPSDAARSRAVLKIVILFVAEYGSTP